jgi:hypothetical protein
MLDPDGPGPGRSGDAADPATPTPADEAQLAADRWAAWWASYAAPAPRPSPAPGLPPGPSTREPPTPESSTAPGLPPEQPAWTRTYELPTARKVVGAGLTLAATSSGAIRRASLYIGLLALGAFGPAIVLLLLAVGRLLSDPGTAAILATDPVQVVFEQPEIVGTFLLIYFLAIVGIVLLVAISIDAQAIAIALLGGIASERPLRLWEAVVRARQTFWRLSVAGFVVGGASAVVSLVVMIPFLRPLDSNTGLTFAGSMIGTLIVTPFAYSATGIVLGDVGAVESLRRSVALFRARPQIALVVVLFTLVTSAIQSFALDAGLDVVIRVADFLNLGLDQGGLGLILPLVLVLAFVMAFGSLTFTIAAIVAAPQVAAFLGLTFYSGGLDRARAADGAPRPRGFRWVSVPMGVTIVGVLLLAVLGVPSIIAFQPRPESPVMSILRSAASDRDVTVAQYGAAITADDPTLDVFGSQRDSIDVVGAGYAYLPEVPEWLLAALFDCGQANVACGDRAGGAAPFSDGAYLFHQRMAGPPGVANADEAVQWGPLIVLDGYYAKALDQDPLGGASHAFVTRMVQGSARLHLFVFHPTFTEDLRTNARSTWIDNDLLTIVPANEMEADPLRWDAFGEILYSRQNGHDSLRATTRSPLLPAGFAPEIDFFSGLSSDLAR